MRINFRIFLTIGSFLILCVSCRQSGSRDEGKTAHLPAETHLNKAVSAHQTAAKPTFPAFDFEETDYDFGEIKEGKVVKHVFRFKNSGDAPLLISDIQTTCGCTTPAYTKTAVAPGEFGEIQVEFNSAGRAGIQRKIITILANTKSQRASLSIAANVAVEKIIQGPYKVQ